MYVSVFPFSRYEDLFTLKPRLCLKTFSAYFHKDHATDMCHASKPPERKGRIGRKIFEPNHKLSIAERGAMNFCEHHHAEAMKE